MRAVMALIREGMKPIDAAKLMQVEPSTVYRSRLYREWKNEQRK